MPPRISIDGRLDIPEDLSVAFRVSSGCVQHDQAQHVLGDYQLGNNMDIPRMVPCGISSLFICYAVHRLCCSCCVSGTD